MVIDWMTILAVAIAVIAGFVLFYIYNRHSTQVVDKAYTLIATLFDTYGKRIEVDDPELYKDIRCALDVMDKAMEDKKISIEETFDIIATYIPLSKRLTKFIQDKY